MITTRKYNDLSVSISVSSCIPIICLHHLFMPYLFIYFFFTICFLLNVKRQMCIPHSLAFISPFQRMFPVIYQRLHSENSWYFSLSTPHSKPVCTDFPHHPSDHSLTETLQQNEILPRYIVLYCYIKSVTSPLHE